MERNDIEFKRRLKIRELIRDLLNVKEELSWLNNPDIMSLYKSINGDKLLTIDDLAPLLYLKLKLEGIKLNEEIKHVVIDEAQDYSVLQFKVIKELTKCISMTVVGDSNQRLLPIEGEVPMLRLGDVFGDLEVEHFALEKSYRSTREIMDYANNFLKDERIVPLVRSGDPVVEKELNGEEAVAEYLRDLLPKLNEKGHESIAIVGRDLNQVQGLAHKLKSLTYIKMIDSEDIIYNGGTVLIPSYFAKGLEFDVVIVVDPTDSIKDESEDKIKYVMCTRALHELYNISFRK